VFRARAYDDGTQMAFERKGDDIIMRIRVADVNAETWTAVRLAFHGNAPFIAIDKGGLLVQMRDAVMRDGTLQRRMPASILKGLPAQSELPKGILWRDFSQSQLIALMCIADITSTKTEAQVAAICGSDVGELKAWDGNEKFLRVKKWMLERSRHKVREIAQHNLGEGLQTDDEALRQTWTRMAFEVLGVIGKTAKVADKGNGEDTALEASVKDILEEMTDDQQTSLVRELKLAANVLSGKGTVTANESGELATKEQSYEQEE